MFGAILATIMNGKYGKRMNYMVKKEFSQESPIIHKECNHRLLQRLPHGMLCCIRCRRTYGINLTMSEIKLNKIEFAELIALMPDKFEGSNDEQKEKSV